MQGLKYDREAANGFDGFPLHIGAGAKVERSRIIEDAELTLAEHRSGL